VRVRPTRNSTKTVPETALLAASGMRPGSGAPGASSRKTTSVGPVQSEVWLTTRCGGSGVVADGVHSFHTPSVRRFFRPRGAMKMRDAAINTPPDLHRLQKCSRKAPPPAERSTSPHSRAVEPRDISWPQQLKECCVCVLRFLRAALSGVLPPLAWSTAPAAEGTNAAELRLPSATFAITCGAGSPLSSGLPTLDVDMAASAEYAAGWSASMAQLRWPQVQPKPVRYARRA